MDTQTPSEAIVAARARTGLSARKFAAKIGVTPQYLCYMESGKYVPSPRVMARIEAIGAGLSADTPPDEVSLLHIYRGLPPPARASLLTAAATLAAQSAPTTEEPQHTA